MGAAGASVDLNADLGEALDGGASDDRAMLAVVTTAHVACGFHAGDAAVMRRTVVEAAAAGVAVGAHPSYPDRAGFGRRDLERTPQRVLADVLFQLGALEGIARAEGVAVVSVKPHGALYNRASVDEECARAIAVAVHHFGAGLPLVLAAGSPGLAAAQATGVPVVAEAFCDRRYRPDGTLVARSDPRALVTDPEEAGDRALGLATRGTVVAVDGTELWLDADTLCVHGDTPGALALAVAVRRRLEAAGVVVAARTSPGSK